MVIVFTGHVLRLGLGLISSAILARGLGPEGLSVFSVVGTVLAIGVTVADLGLSNSAVRYVAGELAASSTRAQSIASVYARLKLLAAIVLCGLLFVLAPPLARQLQLPGGSGPLLLRAAGLGLVTTALSGLIGTLLRALRRFWALVATQLANILLTLPLLGLLFVTNLLDVLPALLVGAFAALSAAGLGFGLLPPAWRRALLARAASAEQSRRDRHRLLSFGKWLWISAILSILLSQLDLLLVNHWLLPRNVGFYALALNLAFKADVLNQTLHTVLLPAASALSGRTAYVRHIRRNLLRSTLVAVLLLPLLLLARPFILLVYGIAYAPSIPIFYALMVIVLFDLLTLPILILAFPMDIPHLIVLADAVSLAILLLVGNGLIPAWGVYGAIVAKLAAKMGGALVLGTTITLRLRRIHEPPI
jgi:O-antigen/teichoic acid export membrane protein